MNLTLGRSSSVRARVRSSSPLRRFSYALTAFALLLQAFAPVSAQAAGLAQAPDAATVRIRIGVVRDGITAVRPADLLAAGIDPATLDPRTFAMRSLGQPVAIYVTGESDGKFDGADGVYFFGQKFRGPEMDQKYTDERVYWLDAGGPAGPRMNVTPADPQFDRTPPRDVASTVHAEVNFIWWPLTTLTLDTQDTWFWGRGQPVSSNGAVTVSLPFTLPYPVAGAPAALRLEQISRTGRWDITPDHRTTVAVNGAPVLDQNWDGMFVRKVFNGTVPPGALKHGLNDVAAGAWTLPNIQTDDVYSNYWEMDYRREFKAYLDQIDFKAEAGGVQEYEVTDWDSGPVFIWDISNPDQPARLTVSSPVSGNRVYLPLMQRSAPPPAGSGKDGGLGPSDAPASVRFRVTANAGARYWLQGAASFNRPATLRLRPPTGLRSAANQADVVIVAPDYLMAAAQPLAVWHQQHGRRAMVVDAQDAYDEFNEGIYHPKAIQGLLKFAWSTWKKPAPQYLTLVGDGHWNPKGYNPATYPPQPNPIPPFLAWVDPWQGEVPADALFGDVTGDGVPEVAVGRLPVNTVAEAETVVQKIVTYDESVRASDWQKRAVFISDNADSAGNFPAVSDEIIAGYTPADLQPVRVYLPPNPPDPYDKDKVQYNAQLVQTRQTVLSTLQAGALMVQFAGHGAPSRWTQEVRTDVPGDLPGIWRTSDIPALTNGGRLPVVMTFNCLDGYFTHTFPSTYAMAELMLRHAGGGSVAAISPTGLGTTEVQHEFRKLLLTTIFKDNVRELGRALTITKQKFYLQYGNHYLIDTMTYFGDPALRLPVQGGQ